MYVVRFKTYSLQCIALPKKQSIQSIQLNKYKTGNFSILFTSSVSRGGGAVAHFAPSSEYAPVKNVLGV